MSNDELKSVIHTFCHGEDKSPFVKGNLFQPGCASIQIGPHCHDDGMFFYTDTRDSKAGPINISAQWTGGVNSGCPWLSFDDSSLNPGKQSAVDICTDRFNVVVNACKPHVLATLQSITDDLTRRHL
jgi:hypothetical protein